MSPCTFEWHPKGAKDGGGKGEHASADATRKLYNCTACPPGETANLTREGNSLRHSCPLAIRSWTGPCATPVPKPAGSHPQLPTGSLPQQCTTASAPACPAEVRAKPAACLAATLSLSSLSLSVAEALLPLDSLAALSLALSTLASCPVTKASNCLMDSLSLLRSTARRLRRLVALTPEPHTPSQRLNSRPNL